jgi:hypothetical protein
MAPDHPEPGKEGGKIKPPFFQEKQKKWRFY